mgnify:CR=1 FL=1
MFAGSGCANAPAPVIQPRMPVVLAGPPPLPKPVVSAEKILAMAIERARGDDFAGAVRAVETLPSAERSAVVRQVITALAQTDPWRAGGVALALPTTLQSEGAEIAVRAMLGRDPAAAVQWALGPTEPVAAYIARKTVADQLVERDPPAAIERLRTLPASEARDQMLGYAAAGWARRNATSATAWMRGLPDDKFRSRMATSIGFEIAQTEPERAVEIVEMVPPGRDRGLLFNAIGQTWVARNANDAWAWARQLPPGDAREAALSGIETGLGGAWSRRATIGAPTAGSTRRRGLVGGGGGAFVVDPSLLPFGPERDDAIRRKFEQALQESPVRAANWLATLPLPDRRPEMADELARQWLKVDPRAAENWMEQNILLSSHREELLREAGR